MDQQHNIATALTDTLLNGSFHLQMLSILAGMAQIDVTNLDELFYKIQLGLHHIPTTYDNTQDLNSISTYNSSAVIIQDNNSHQLDNIWVEPELTLDEYHNNYYRDIIYKQYVNSIPYYYEDWMPVLRSDQNDQSSTNSNHSQNTNNQNHNNSNPSNNNNNNNNNTSSILRMMQQTPILWLQYQHVISKCWYCIGLLHLQYFSPQHYNKFISTITSTILNENKSITRVNDTSSSQMQVLNNNLQINIAPQIFFGINTTRYTSPYEYYSQGSFSIKFPPPLTSYLNHPYSNLTAESNNNDNNTQHENNNNNNNNNKNNNKNGNVFIIKPHHILQVLTTLYKSNNLSPLTVYYLTTLLPLPSFCELASAILSPHFDFILPIHLFTRNNNNVCSQTNSTSIDKGNETFNGLLTPALFNTVFVMLITIYNDLLFILQPIYQLLFKIPDLDIIKYNTYPLLFAQPAGDVVSPLHISKHCKSVDVSNNNNHDDDNNNQFVDTKQIQPKSILVTLFQTDGQLITWRVTNGMK